MNETAVLLAGDVGATKTHLAVFSLQAGLRAPLAEATFASGDYPSLEALVRAFLPTIDRLPERAVFGVAGPVVAGRAHITNLPWTIDEQELRQALGLPTVHLLNDLAAIAQAVPLLGADDLHTLARGEAAPGGAIAVVAPGTGLGEAFLTWDGVRYHAHPSEGGHTDFAPTTPLEIELLRYLLSRFERVSYERICSGLGLPNIYAFLKSSGRGEEPAWLAEQLAQADDHTPVIVQAALDDERHCPLCADTLALFTSILGAEAGNLALKVLATGGVVLGGGIPPRILPILENGPFLSAFRRKGRFSRLMAQMPVRVILNPRAALLGAASYGLAVCPGRTA